MQNQNDVENQVANEANGNGAPNQENEDNGNMNDLFEVSFILKLYNKLNLPFLYIKFLLHYLILFQELNQIAQIQIQNFEVALTPGRIYQVTELYRKDINNSSSQIIGVVKERGELPPVIKHVYMVADLVKNFTPSQVIQMNNRISHGAAACFQYDGKVKTNFGCGYKFAAKWVRN